MQFELLIFKVLINVIQVKRSSQDTVFLVYFCFIFDCEHFELLTNLLLFDGMVPSAKNPFLEVPQYYSIVLYQYYKLIILLTLLYLFPWDNICAYFIYL